MDAEQLLQMILSFNETEQNPHFDRQAFKVKGKRIYATMHEESGTLNLKLSPGIQKTFCEYEGGNIYAVTNKFGNQGWTTFQFQNLPSELIFEALNLAYTDTINGSKK